MSVRIPCRYRDGRKLRMAPSLNLRATGLVALIILAVGGCSLFPSPAPSLASLYVPDTAGIVASVETGESSLVYTLTNGQTVTIPNGAPRPAASDPEVGDLLVSGTQPALWVDGLAALDPVPVPKAASCYVLVGKTRESPTALFITVHSAKLGDSVVVYRKAPTWQTPEWMKVAGSDELLGVFNCINERGEATEHRIGQ